MLTQLSRYENGAHDKGFNGGLWATHPMMMGSGTNSVWIFSTLTLVTWILVIAVLIALLRWLWKKGDNERVSK